MILNDIFGDIQKELLIVLILLIIGLTLIVLSIRVIMKSKKSINWPITDGVIMKSGLTTTGGDSESSTICYNAEIKYKYKVDCIEFESTRIYFGSKISSSGKQEKSKLLVRKYPEFKKVSVYYNLENFKESVLETDVQSGLYWGLVLGIPVTIFLVLFYCMKHL